MRSKLLLLLVLLASAFAGQTQALEWLEDNVDSSTGQVGDHAVWGNSFAVMALKEGGKSTSAPIDYLLDNQNSDHGFGYPGYDSDAGHSAVSVIALETANEDITSGMVDYILSQRTGSGFKGWSGATEANVDTTAWATIALAQQGESVSYVENYFNSVQKSDGSFPGFTGESSVEFTSEALIALQWIGEENSDAVDFLLDEQGSNDCFGNAWETSLAIIALENDGEDVSDAKACLLNLQESDGGFSRNDDGSNSVDTAVAYMALKGDGALHTSGTGGVSVDVVIDYPFLVREDVEHSVSINAGDSALDAFRKVVAVEDDNGFVTSVGGMEPDYDATEEYWAFFINGDYAEIGADEYEPDSGDEVALSYYTPTTTIYIEDAEHEKYVYINDSRIEITSGGWLETDSDGDVGFTVRLIVGEWKITVGNDEEYFTVTKSRPTQNIDFGYSSNDVQIVVDFPDGSREADVDDEVEYDSDLTVEDAFEQFVNLDEEDDVVFSVDGVDADDDAQEEWVLYVNNVKKTWYADMDVDGGDELELRFVAPETRVAVEDASENKKVYINDQHIGETSAGGTWADYLTLAVGKYTIRVGDEYKTFTVDEDHDEVELDFDTGVQEAIVVRVQVVFPEFTEDEVDEYVTVEDEDSAYKVLRSVVDIDFDEDENVIDEVEGVEVDYEEYGEYWALFVNDDRVADVDDYEVEDGDDLELKFVAPETLFNITTKRSKSIYLDDEKIGRSDYDGEFTESLLLKAGAYELKFDDFEEDVDVGEYHLIVVMPEEEYDDEDEDWDYDVFYYDDFGEQESVIHEDDDYVEYVDDGDWVARWEEEERLKEIFSHFGEKKLASAPKYTPTFDKPVVIESRAEHVVQRGVEYNQTAAATGLVTFGGFSYLGVGVLAVIAGFFYWKTRE